MSTTRDWDRVYSATVLAEVWEAGVGTAHTMVDGVDGEDGADLGGTGSIKQKTSSDFIVWIFRYGSSSTVVTEQIRQLAQL